MTSPGASTAATSEESKPSIEPVRGAGVLGRGGTSSTGLVAGLSGGKSKGESPAFGKLGATGGVVPG